MKGHKEAGMKRACVLASLLSGVLLFFTLALTGAKSPSSGPLLVESDELAKTLADANLRILDARPPEEYREGHLPGAVNLPAPATESLEANKAGFPLPPGWAEELFRMAGINRTSRVVIYDNQGDRFAARVFYVLEFFGHSNVQVLNGGIAKWKSEGRPITNNVPEVASGDFKPEARPAVIATADWVRQHLGDASVRLVDARSPEEFRGTEIRGPRGGHIPGAVNVEWTRVLAAGASPTLLDRAALKKLFSGAHVSPSQEVVSYCQTGMRAAEIYFALRLLGYPRVRLYDGSWAEWSANPALPVEK
jgi:thiosulfate/3-mercaptopyruvate sulfurtransferase